MMTKPTDEDMEKGSEVSIAYGDGNGELFVLIGQAIADARVAERERIRKTVVNVLHHAAKEDLAMARADGSERWIATEEGWLDATEEILARLAPAAKQEEGLG